jgi:hypothetical protein
MNTVLLGMPGLYQNWVMAAVDPDSKFQLHGKQNFFCIKSKVKWLIKPGMSVYPEPAADSTIINLYVKEHNFPWYLYNLFEKTYDIKIMIDTLVQDLLNNGDKFTIFAEFKNLLLQIDHKDNDAVINLFYLLFLENKYYLCKTAEFTNPLYINIEYNDFLDRACLLEKLQHVPGFDSNHFDLLYQQLVDRNQRYFTRKQDYLDKLAGSQNFDLIELAYTGKLASMLYGKQIDWINPKFRMAVLKTKQNELCDLAKKMCYNY